VRHSFRRVLELASLLARRPTEFVDRVEGLIDRFTDRLEHPATPPSTPEALWPFIDSALGIDASAFLKEGALAEADTFLTERIASLPLDLPFATTNCAERFLGHLAYVICRALQPDAVVETGVAYGSMTTYILTALRLNDHGMLHSIDLPSILDPDARSVGRLVPDRLRDRWSLYLGASRRVLPKLLNTIGPVGLFVHDSLHTKRNMAREFNTVTPHLAKYAVVLADDVHCSGAFEDWAKETATQWAPIRQIERQGWVGVAFMSPVK
jgi:predicted O-methyltransferase YrrM